ncbi:MAG: cold shock domain-containing protein [candidate division WOR-3 bacterium]
MKKKGTIKSVFTDRGFGFISPEGGGCDVFFHVSRYTGDVPFSSLQKGDTVFYVDEIKDYRVRAKLVRFTNDKPDED